MKNSLSGLIAHSEVFHAHLEDLIWSPFLKKSAEPNGETPLNAEKPFALVLIKKFEAC